MLSIMFGQSKYYVDNLSENIRRASGRVERRLYQLAPLDI